LETLWDDTGGCWHKYFIISTPIVNCPLIIKSAGSI